MTLRHWFSGTFTLKSLVARGHKANVQDYKPGYRAQAFCLAADQLAEGITMRPFDGSNAGWRKLALS